MSFRHATSSCALIPLLLLSTDARRYNADGLQLGKELKKHKDVVIHAAETEIVRHANLPRAPRDKLGSSEKVLDRHCRERRNACYLTLTNKPYYLLRACKDIHVGKAIEAYYGPASGQLLNKFMHEKFVC